MTLSGLRKRIDEIDRQIISLLEQRMVIVDEIKKIKQAQGISIEDTEREKEVKRKKSSVLTPLEIEQIFDVIIHIAKQRQQEE
jgi:chorismate mutase